VHACSTSTTTSLHSIKVANDHYYRYHISRILESSIIIHNNIIVHPGKLTWNPKMEVWKMMFLFSWVMFRFIILCLPGCMVDVVDGWMMIQTSYASRHLPTDLPPNPSYHESQGHCEPPSYKNKMGKTPCKKWNTCYPDEVGLTDHAAKHLI